MSAADKFAALFILAAFGGLFLTALIQGAIDHYTYVGPDYTGTDQ